MFPLTGSDEPFFVWKGLIDSESLESGMSGEGDTMTNARSISSGTSRDQGLCGWAYYDM